MKSTKLLSLFLAMLLLLSTFVSCSFATGNKPPVTDPSGDGTTAPEEGTTIPEEVVQNIVLAENGESLYRVVYDKDMSANAKDAITMMVARAKSTYGINLTATDDESYDRVSETESREILIGLTNRQESEKANTNLRAKEYIIAYSAATDAVVIAAGSESYLILAIGEFLSTFGDKTAHSITIPADLHLYTADAYPITTLTVDGVDLREYTVVIPTDCDNLTLYAAYNLQDVVKQYYGIELPLVYDADEAASPYEILIGKTNRPESNVTNKPQGEQYLLVKKGDKIVMQGENIYVGAGVGTFVAYLKGEGNGRVVEINDISATETPATFVFPTTYKNAILMIGDGMGFNHIAMTEASKNGVKTFAANYLPVKGSAQTYSQSVTNGTAAYTDSAAGGTALATGYKTINSYIGMDPNQRSVQNLRELADSIGGKTAVVTTDVITGATPSAFLAHCNNRNSTSELQSQINALVQNKLVDYCMGNAGDNLTVHTRAALNTISNSDAPFFLMVEGAHIDKRSHDNDYDGVIYMTKRFSDSIAYVIEFMFCHPETALIITADHETGGLTYRSQEFNFTVTTHTNVDVPVYAFGAGVEVFNNTTVNNIEIAKFLAKAFGAQDFGQ